MKLLSSLTGEVPDESPKVEVQLASPVSFYVVLAAQTLAMLATAVFTVQLIYPPALVIVICIALFFALTAFVNYHFGQAGCVLVLGVLGALSLGSNELDWKAPVFATLVIFGLRSHFLLSSVDKKHAIDGTVIAAELFHLGKFVAGIWVVWGLTVLLGGLGSGLASLAAIACGITALVVMFGVNYKRTKRK